MDDKKEKNAGGITHFCLKHLVALMVTVSFFACGYYGLFHWSLGSCGTGKAAD